MTKPSALALLPLVLFLSLFVGAGLWYQAQGTEMAFYQISAPVAILPAIALALLLARGSLDQRIEKFVRGVGDHTVITMVLIYLLAGGFASVARAVGGVDATVGLALGAIPPDLVLPGLFAITALVATAMGTSMGTVAAIAPIAIGLADGGDLPLLATLGAVVGGAMLGDNLSVISDTTIAATRSQGVDMRDKFRLNFRIALPAALLTLVWLYFQGSSASAAPPAAEQHQLLRVLPYLLVLLLAVIGINVFLVLFTGIVCAGAVGLALQPDYSVAVLARDIYAGYSGMQEILILSLLIGGLGALMKSGGGLAWLAQGIARCGGRGSTRAGELAIGGVVAATNVCVANNTVAILLNGELARDIAARYGVDPRRSASLLDIFSCVVQGLLPYGAQALLASSLAGISPLALVGHIQYCWLLGLAALGSILFAIPRSVRQASVDPASAQ
ncbi:Na+/H+ antiporter NhaC family protein [Microbulbifer sp. SAOS-129_SWC]|uniref:Na+/H+ antiporter NhaC family protein n=1 Tax=Microbulbifer sp. SAOS-129_SWC TaxID=3145235 RepID=UPI0032162A4B